MTSCMLTAAALYLQDMAWIKTSLNLGRQGRCLHAHMHHARGIHRYQSRYAQASCHAVQIIRPVMETGDGDWMLLQSGAGAVACSPRVPGQCEDTERLGHPGEGADVSGTGKVLGLHPLQLVQEKGLIHIAL